MSAHVLLNLLNKFGKRDKRRGLPSVKASRNLLDWRPTQVNEPYLPLRYIEDLT